MEEWETQAAKDAQEVTPARRPFGHYNGYNINDFNFHPMMNPLHAGEAFVYEKLSLSTAGGPIFSPAQYDPPSQVAAYLKGIAIQDNNSGNYRVSAYWCDLQDTSVFHRVLIGSESNVNSRNMLSDSPSPLTVDTITQFTATTPSSSYLIMLFNVTMNVDLTTTTHLLDPP